MVNPHVVETRLGHDALRHAFGVFRTDVVRGTADEVSDRDVSEFPFAADPDEGVVDRVVDGCPWGWGVGVRKARVTVLFSVGFVRDP